MGLGMINEMMLSDALRRKLVGSPSMAFSEYNVTVEHTQKSIGCVGGEITSFSDKLDGMFVFRNGLKLPREKYTIAKGIATFEDTLIAGDELNFVQIKSEKLSNLPTGNVKVITEKVSIEDDADEIEFVPSTLTVYSSDTDTIIVVYNTTMLTMGEHFVLNEDETRLRLVDGTKWEADASIVIYYFRI